MYIRLRNVLIGCLLGACICAMLLYSLLNGIEDASSVDIKSVKTTPENKILLKVSQLADNYKSRSLQNDQISEDFLKNAHPQPTKDLRLLWSDVNSWVSKNAIFKMNSTNVGAAIGALRSAKVTKFDLDTRGTQLKFLLTLEGDQQVVFKPKWYAKDKQIDGPVYSGKDRYNSEILGFYLSAILNKPLAPISTRRKFHIRNELLPVGTDRLLLTHFERGNRSCIYGECFYCTKLDPLCADGDGFVEGAVIFNINRSFKVHRSPWQRTYKSNKSAVWQENESYCKSLKTRYNKQRLYDLVDTAIFDFLIQNGDRHHFETLNDRIVLLDNGKGLGNTDVNHIDILAPLYQCCMIRGSMWNRLLDLTGGLLRDILMSIPIIREAVSDAHIDAVDTRLLLIFSAVEYCKGKVK